MAFIEKISMIIKKTRQVSMSESDLRNKRKSGLSSDPSVQSNATQNRFETENSDNIFSRFAKLSQNNIPSMGIV
jgi:hypothetical protein